jgi:beta-hydroxylase
MFAMKDSKAKNTVYFYDTDKFAWSKIIVQAYPDIKKEWDRFPRFLRLRCSTGHHGQWDTVPLVQKSKKNWRRFFFPKTYALLKKAPISDNLGFSIFYPGCETIKHTGWSKDYVRGQMGIDGNSQSALHCGNESKNLKNGEILMFEDSEEHFAYNRGATERIVLIFDMHKKDIGL